MKTQTSNYASSAIALSLFLSRENQQYRIEVILKPPLARGNVSDPRFPRCCCQFPAPKCMRYLQTGGWKLCASPTRRAVHREISGMEWEREREREREGRWGRKIDARKKPQRTLRPVRNIGWRARASFSGRSSKFSTLPIFSFSLFHFPPFFFPRPFSLFCARCISRELWVSAVLSALSTRAAERRASGWVKEKN